MKKLILSIVFLVSVIASFGQAGALSQSVYRSRVNDSTSVTTPAGYGLMYYNNQRSTPVWMFSNDQGATWHVLGTGSGGGGLTLVNGNITTVNGTADGLDVGGTADKNTDLDMNGFRFNVFDAENIGLTSATGNVAIESTTSNALINGVTTSIGDNGDYGGARDFLKSDLSGNAQWANVTVDDLVPALNASRTFTTADDLDQTDNLSIVYANSATPFNITADLLTAGSQVTIWNKGSATVTLIAGSGVTLSSVPIATDEIAVIVYEPAATPSVRLSSGSGGAGTVTSVAASVPSIFSISGSPITTSGTLAMTYSGTALPVANGGTNATSAGITAFNNITGYTASGSTGTTSTNLVFSTSPTLVTPALGTPSALVGTNITGTATGLTSGITNALKSATTTVDVSAATAPTSGQVLTATAGTTATWQTPASGFANPMTTLGDIIYENATPTPTRLAGNTTTTKMFLNQTGNGSISAAPTWAALVSGDIPALAYWKLTGTSTLTGASTITSSQNNGLIFNGTTTFTANNDFLVNFGGAVTGSSGNTSRAYLFNPAITGSGTTNVNIGVDIAPTFSGGTTPSTMALRVQGLTYMGTTNPSTYNGRLYATAASANRVALMGNLEITTDGVPAWSGVGIGAVGQNRQLVLSGNGATTDNDAVIFNSLAYGANRSGVDLGIWNGTLPTFTSATFQANSLAAFRFNSTWPTLTTPMAAAIGYDYNPGGGGSGGNATYHYAYRAVSGSTLLGATTIGTANTRLEVHAAGNTTELITRFANQSGTTIMSLSAGGSLSLYRTITTAGTTGAQTINRPSGTVNFAAASTSLVVTNNLVDANSIVQAIVRTNDTTAKTAVAVSASGSFTIYLNAAATAETSVAFLVMN